MRSGTSSKVSPLWNLLCKASTFLLEVRVTAFAVLREAAYLLVRNAYARYIPLLSYFLRWRSCCVGTLLGFVDSSIHLFLSSLGSPIAAVIMKMNA